MEPSCIDLYVFAGQSNVLGWGVGPLEEAFDRSEALRFSEACLIVVGTL